MSSELLQRGDLDGRIYGDTYVSPHAHVHQGDNYYVNATPSRSRVDEICSTLDFSERLSRYDSIEDSYSDTFSWILQPPDNTEVVWDSFVDWVLKPGGIYWVSGKPGSGKSTLMKYLYNEVQKRKIGPSENLIFLSFWFWEAAHDPLQKSFKGCLQSLLVQILRHEALGRDFTEMITRSSGKLWTIPQLMNTTKTVLKRLQSQKVGVFMFLDGLDESVKDGDVVAKFVIDTAQSFPNSKFCVSSRLERLFETRFAAYPKLKMQDLNSSDIDIIINEDLLQSSEYVAMDHHDTESEELRLRDTIQWKAQGVILWVQLVIKDILRGIRNWDTAEELQKRIDNMPDELERLYDMMLRRHSPDARHYRDYATFYCQLASHRKLNIIEFCLATDDDVRTAYSQLYGDWLHLHNKLNCERAKVWINVRTGGLLEVKHNTRIKVYRHCTRSRSKSLTEFLDFYLYHNVQFIHRTARTYFLDILNGQQLRTSALKSEVEIAHLCFESRLVCGTVLRAIESVSPISRDVFGSVLFPSYDHECDCKDDTLETKRVYVESTLHALENRHLLWTENFSQTLSSTLVFSKHPFATDERNLLNYNHLYANTDRFDWLQSRLSLLSIVTAEQSSVLIPGFAFRHGFNSPEWGSILQHIHRSGLSVSMKNSYGEEISILHETFVNLVKYKEDTNLHADLWEWLCRVDPSSLTRVVGPTIGRCSSLFFSPRRSSAMVYLLGSSDLKSMQKLYRNSLPQSLNDRFARDCSKTHYGPLVIFIWPRCSWFPKMYAVQKDEFTNVFRVLESAKREWKSDIKIANHRVGILQVRETTDWEETFFGTKKVFPMIEQLLEQLQPFKTTPLPSLYAALLHINKDETALRAFAATEEKRLAVAVNDTVFRLWKAWFSGIIDPDLEPYINRGRPENWWDWPYCTPPGSDNGDADI